MSRMTGALVYGYKGARVIADLRKTNLVWSSHSPSKTLQWAFLSQGRRSARAARPLPNLA